MKAVFIRATEIDDENGPEPVPGLPGPLPEGEAILWRGSPTFIGLAVHAFHIRAVAIYFAVAGAWRAIGMASSGAESAEILSTLAIIACFAAAGVGVLSLMAFLMQRETIYTITTKRVVLRFGVALRKTVNIPFRIIGAASLKRRPNGLGDIPLTLSGPDRIGYIHLWPHVRPYRYGNAEPMLRAIPDAARVARILADAVKAQSPDQIAVTQTTLVEPALSPRGSADRKPRTGEAAAAA